MMIGRAGLRRAAPWVLCWISAALLVAATILRAAFPVDGEVRYEAVVGAFGFLLVPLVGALIASRQPANPYGWLWCGLGFVLLLQVLFDGLQRAGAVPGWVAIIVVVVAFPAGLCLLVFIFLLFPTGMLPSRRWRWLARIAVVLTAVGVLGYLVAPMDTAADSAPWALEGRAGAALGDVLNLVIQAMFLLIMVSAASVLVRFRRAGPVERQQLKWFLLGAFLFFLTTAWDLVGLPANGPVWSVVDAVTFSALPAAVGIAVLRYRLYEIDRIVSRTVSYGLLSAGLIGLYLLAVALLRPLLDPVTGSSSLAVAASTLAVAAVFNPGRRRLQAIVDRRFDRARYDADRAVQAFAARLRTQVDLDEVTSGLRDTVVTTVAPSRVAVWLRVPSGTGRN
jgi:hypothetical protein